jgi:hypothetical protein
MSTEFVKAKFGLAITSLIIGVPTLIFASLGWTPSGYAIVDNARYVCIIGSAGALVLGGLLFNEARMMVKARTILAKKSVLDFLTVIDHDEM